MMINSSSYSTNDLVFNKFQMCDQDLRKYLASSQGLKVARVDSRARALRSHQVLKRILARWIKIWTKSRRRRRFSKEDFKKTCVMFVSVKIYF